MAHTIDEIFAALMPGEESTKTAGDENGGEATSTDKDQNQNTAPAENTDAAAKAGEAQKEAALALAKILPADQINALRSFVKQAEEQEKDAELMKQAEEAIMTGRFMARGFKSELDKLSAENSGEADFSDKSITMGAANVPTPQPGNIVVDGSTAINTAKKEDGVKSPASPTTSQDVMSVVKAVVNAADVASKGQDPQEVPNNLGIKDSATSGNMSAQPNNKGA